MNVVTEPLLQVITGLPLISLHCCHQKNKIKSFSRPARSHIISLWCAWALISWNLWHDEKRGTATGLRRTLLTICENRSTAHRRRTAVNVREREANERSQPPTQRNISNYTWRCSSYEGRETSGNRGPSCTHLRRWSPLAAAQTVKIRWKQSVGLQTVRRIREKKF